ncbi:MAG: hypothetical protein KA176_11595 [Alphaproteobacteria bacterium]|nr:hypothetical protein [Alphaproteobacteria bacterium]
MIDREYFISTILSEFPEFLEFWQEHLRYWDGEVRTVGIDVSAFSSFVISEISNMSKEKRQCVFALVEKSLNYGTEDIKAAVATQFLENLLNAESAKKIKAEDFIDFLQPESRKYCEAWDNFTGIKNN